MFPTDTIANSVGNMSLGCHWPKLPAPILCFSIRLISRLILSNQLPWAAGIPGGVHRLPNREIRLQSGSKISSSNFQYPLQRGRMEDWENGRLEGWRLEGMEGPDQKAC